VDAQYLTDEELYDKYGDRLVRFAATIVGPPSPKTSSSTA